MEKHFSVKKTFVRRLLEVIKAFMKTKENGGNIYKMRNAWLKNCKSILAFMKKNKGYKE